MKDKKKDKKKSKDKDKKKKSKKVKDKNKKKSKKVSEDRQPEIVFEPEEEKRKSFFIHLWDKYQTWLRT
jgi:hypothetical protein